MSQMEAIREDRCQACDGWVTVYYDHGTRQLRCGRCSRHPYPFAPPVPAPEAVPEGFSKREGNWLAFLRWEYATGRLSE